MPRPYYLNNTYPSYIGGPAYVMSGDSNNKLINTINKYNGSILDLEDVFITGIISEISFVKRHHSDLFKLIDCNNVCALHESIAVFMCEDIHQMKKFWQNWIKSSPDKCHTKKLG